jgi:hypothetical protein
MPLSPAPDFLTGKKSIYCQPAKTVRVNNGTGPDIKNITEVIKICFLIRRYIFPGISTWNIRQSGYLIEIAWLPVLIR